MWNIKKYIGYLLPHGVVLFYHTAQESKREKIRNDRIAEVKKSLPSRPQDFTYDEIIGSLVDQGIDRGQILSGSIPESHLAEIVDIIRQHFGTCAITGLHIGNFVGVSLVYLAGLLTRLNERSIIVSIDPNIPHRGIVNPQTLVIYLVNKFGLSKNIGILTGYSLEKSISNDGKEYTEYDPQREYSREYSCEGQLELLNRISAESYEFIVIDGNHERTYLHNELTLVQDLLCPNGLIIVDDVSEGWTEIKETFETFRANGIERIFSNGRIGVFRKYA